MQKNNVIFLLATAIVVTAIFWGRPVLAAQVTNVDYNEGHVYIDQGKDAGFVFGAEVCFYKPSGEKITCGEVRQSQANRAMVRVNNRLSKSINKGMKAELKSDKSK